MTVDVLHPEVDKMRAGIYRRKRGVRHVEYADADEMRAEELEDGYFASGCFLPKPLYGQHLPVQCSRDRTAFGEQKV